MLFHSQTFILVFLPVVLASFYAVAGHQAARQWVLVAASLFFYAYWDVRFLPLLLTQAVATWLLSQAARRARVAPLVVAGIVLNLGILGYFKYRNFFLEGLTSLLGNAPPVNNLILPIGISFYTFELISFLVDQHRGQLPRYRFREFMVFVTFFPRLIAGPIVRHHEIIPGAAESPLRPGLAERLGQGGTLFIIGLAKKVLLADHLAKMADPAFAAASQHAVSAADAWNGTLAFSLQLFLDFSAYSEMAIGLGMMFGIILPINFNMPYRAVSIRDFWRRWHMTLSRFLRDYLYIPLGGSRRGPARYVAATLVTMGLCGLWHGAGVTFVVWGMMHGVALVICHFWQRLRRPLPLPLAWALTLAFVIAGWVIFRAPDFHTAANMFASLGGMGGDIASAVQPRPWLLAIAAAVSLVGPTSLDFATRWVAPRPAYAVGFAALAVVCVLEVGKGAPITFIYFQF